MHPTAHGIDCASPKAAPSDYVRGDEFARIIDERMRQWIAVIQRRRRSPFRDNRNAARHCRDSRSSRVLHAARHRSQNVLLSVGKKYAVTVDPNNSAHRAGRPPISVPRDTARCGGPRHCQFNLVRARLSPEWRDRRYAYTQTRSGWPKVRGGRITGNSWSPLSVPMEGPIRLG